MSSNEDFKHPTPAVQLLGPLAQHLSPAQTTAAQAVAGLLDDRDRVLEDYLNRNVVRRVWSENVLGTNHAHLSTTYIDVVPACEVDIQKANLRSLLLVTLGVNGLYADAGAPSFVDLGAHIVGPAGYDEQFGIASKTGRTTGTEMTHAALKAVAGGAPAGPYTVTLQVKVSQAGASWTSGVSDTISMSVTEIPGP